MRTRSLLLVAPAFLVACAGAPAPPPAVPAAPPPAASAPPVQTTLPAHRDPFAVRVAPREELPPEPTGHASLGALGPLPAGVPAAPRSCDAWVRRAPAASAACTGAGAATAALASLDAALAVADEAKRDAALAGLEACDALPAGIVRALRIELAPAACGDALADPWLRAAKGEVATDVVGAIRGHAIAARLSRTVGAPPKLAPPFDKARVAAFVSGELARWMTAQAKVVEQLAREAVALPVYGRGVAATAAALADFRFVEVVRAAPVPDEFAKDAELRDTYLGSLEQSLDPRKDRGRDAALVGLRDLAAVGALHDARADRARELLSTLYGGRRIDALDALLLPPAEPAPSGRVDERLAARLPAFFSGVLLAPALALDAGVLRALLERGFPAPHRLALDRAEKLPDEVARLGARGRLLLAMRSWRAIDVERAIALAAPLVNEREAPAEGDRLLLALALALRGGPDDAAEMMRRAPGLALGSMGDTLALDEVARADGPLGARAAFDAALVRAVARPDEPSAAYWSDVASRFRAAAAGLDGAARAGAEERARAADERAGAAKP